MNIFVLLAAITAFISIIPYSMDAIAGKTRPHRTTWLLLSLLAIGFVYGQIVSKSYGGGLYLSIAQMIAVMFVFALSIKYGEGGVKTFEIALLIIAAVSLGIGIFQKQGDTILYINIFTGLIAYLPTFVKTWRKPETETLITWWLGVFGAVLGLMGSIGSPFSSIVYLSYVLLVNFGVAIIIVIRRPVQINNFINVEMNENPIA